jgi:site-specific DNA recombinase
MDIYTARQELRFKKLQDLHIRVVHYDRVSTEKEEQKSSIVNQNLFSEEIIRNNPNWVYAGRYADEAITGLSTEKRPGFSQMMLDAKCGKFDLIITKEVPRFARNTLDSIQCSRKLLEYGVGVWFINNNLNTISEESEFLLTIMAGQAQEESRRISNRVKFGQAQSIKRGHVLGADNMYGFVKKDCALTVKTEDVAMIRYIFERYASGKVGTKKLGDELYEKGYTNRKGGVLHSKTIQSIIQNPKYKGYYCGGKVVVEDMFTKKQRFLPESEWVLYKDDGTTVPAIISEELWDRANKVLKERSDKFMGQNRTASKNNRFTGKIICENDGAAFWLTSRGSGKNRKDLTWICSEKKTKGTSTCDSLAIKESELLAIVKDIINEHLGGISSVIDLYLEELSTISLQSDSKDEILRWEKELELIEKKRERLLEHNLNGYIDNEDFYQRDLKLKAQRSEIANRIEELSQKLANTDLDQIKKKIRKHFQEVSEITDQTITAQTIDILFDKIYAKRIGKNEMQLQFQLNLGYNINKTYEKKSAKKNMSCPDTMVKKMIEQQEQQMAGK